MNSKKLLCALCCVAIALPCVACNSSTPPPDSGEPSFPDYSDGEIPDNNNVDVSEPDTTEHSFGLLTQNGGTLTYKCSHCNETETAVISCESGTANGFAVNGNTVTFCNITENSVYNINGSLHGNIVIDISDDYKFELQMSGFDLYSYTECPINITGGDKVTLSAKNSTENHIYDMREAADENSVSASIYAQCDLDIQGKGKLDVKSVNNNGILTKDDLKIKNLSLQVDCKDNALKGNDSVTIESGDLVLISRKGDGIKTTNSNVSSKGNQRGNVTISGGDVLIYAACNGIDSAYDTVIKGSSAATHLQIFTDKYSKFSEISASSTSPARNERFPGGPGGPGGMIEGNPDKGDYSTKGIFANNCVNISDGKITISSYDDAVHARNGSALENGGSSLGNIYISGGDLALRSNDDAIHADGGIRIANGNIYVVNSHEGIEGNTVEISGGNISVISSEDGINGAADAGSAITISGGKLYVYAGGDGVDSNSKASYAGILFSGGTSVIISTGQADSSIDTERGYKYTGGYVVAVGRSGGMSNESTNCSGFSSIGTSKNISLQKDGYLTVADVATIKMPVSINALVVCLGKSNASISSSSSASYTLDANGVYWNI